MQNNPQPYRFSGLIAIIGLVFLVAGLSILFALTEIRVAAWVVMGIGVVFLAVAFISEFRNLSGALTGRRGRLNISTTVMASIFVGIVILANAISFNNYHRFDTTALGQFTLSDQTKNLLENLKTPVDVLAFYEPGDTIGDYADNLLTEYEKYTPKLSHKVIDPVAHPDQASQFGITQSPAFVFETQTHRKLVSYSDIITMDSQGNNSFEVEHPFSSALMEVTGVAQKKVYFLTGHGEHDINSDYSYAALGLQDDLYQVGIVNLLTDPTIPSDCAALIIASPKTPLTSPEVDIIKAYLQSGDRQWFWLTPGSRMGSVRFVLSGALI